MTEITQEQSKCWKRLCLSQLEALLSTSENPPELGLSSGASWAAPRGHRGGSATPQVRLPRPLPPARDTPLPAAALPAQRSPKRQQALLNTMQNIRQTGVSKSYTYFWKYYPTWVAHLLNEPCASTESGRRLARTVRWRGQGWPQPLPGYGGSSGEGDALMRGPLPGCAHTGTGTALPRGALRDRRCRGRGAEPRPSGAGRLHQRHLMPHLPVPCSPALSMPRLVLPSRGWLPPLRPGHHPALLSHVPSPLSSCSGISAWRFDHVCIFFLLAHLSSSADLAHHFNPLAAEQVSGGISCFICK